jgi:putative transposase
MKYAAELYRPSPRPCTGFPDLNYPIQDRTVTVTQWGRLCLGRRKINLSAAFAGQNVGLREVAERIWLISFGCLVRERGRVDQHWLSLQCD